MIVLVGCEESQAVCIEFRKLGHEAYSCDLQECSGGHPEWHLQMDVFAAIKLKKWDLIILHPPCIYTALCGNRWYYNSQLRIEGIKFCKDVFEAAQAVCVCVWCWNNLKQSCRNISDQKHRLFNHGNSDMGKQKKPGYGLLAYRC